MSNASTGNKMFTSPEVMTIILNRGKGLEFQVEFEYPLYLNIDKYVIDKSQNNNNNYELICVLTHLGPSGMSGHFIAFCKSPNDDNDKWFCYNDATVTEIDNPTENNDGEFESVPYVLFYQRCSQDKILNNNNSNIRGNQKKNSYKYNNIESSGIYRINNNDTLTLYFSYKTKEFYLDVDKNEKISNLIKKLNKKYKIPKNVTFYRQVVDNLLEIKSYKTVKDNNLKNEDKIVVLDDDPNDYGYNNANNYNYFQYYY
jgi:ubiquitin carboxyl-terminal hydrolase 36/42